MAEAKQRCAACGTRLARDNTGCLCSPCLASRRDYNPFHDPTLGERLLDLLLVNVGVPVRVHRELGIAHCGVAAWSCVKAHIRRLRRHGYVIVGSHDGTYTLLSDRRVPRNGPGSGSMVRHHRQS